MDIKAIYQEIEVGKVDTDDRTFLLTPNGEAEAMTDTTRGSAVRKLMLTPPLLQINGEMFRIITGYELFRYFKCHTDNGTLSCLIVGESSNPLELLALALESIHLSRNPSPVEEASCLDKAIKAAGTKKAISFFTPLLSLSHRYDPDNILHLLEFDSNRLKALHNGRLEISTAFSLLELDETDSNELFRLIIELKLSTSNQKKLVRNCSELNKRKNLSIKDILSDSSIISIMQNQAIDNQKKTSQIMNWLHRQLFPKLSGAEEDFQNFIAQLDLPKNSEIRHAPAFEKDTITFSTTFKDRNSFIDKLPILKEIIHK